MKTTVRLQHGAVTGGGAFITASTSGEHEVGHVETQQLQVAGGEWRLNVVVQVPTFADFARRRHSQVWRGCSARVLVVLAC